MTAETTNVQEPKILQLKVDKIQTSVKKGYKLGSTSATWKKLKQVTSDPRNKSDTIVESGPSGEIFIVHTQTGKLELWYWLDPEESDASNPQYYSGDTLYFYCSSSISTGFKIVSFHYVEGDMVSGYQFLVVSEANELYLYQVDANGKTSKENFTVTRQIYDNDPDKKPGYLKLIQTLKLPDYFTECNDKDSEFTTEISIKISKKFIVAANSKGLVYVWRYGSRLYVPANQEKKLSNLKKSASLPILRNLKLLDKVTDETIIFKTSCANGKPIFDLKNNWLVYSPCKVEYQQTKISGTGLTPVQLPSSKRLLKNVLENLSNNALDSLFKLSKYSNQKINDYLNNDQSVDFKTIKKSLNKLLNQTINSISDSIGMSDNQMIKIVDLDNDKVLCLYKSPDGISHVSFNPYDLQLVSCTLRGDNFFLWDLIKLTSEISLMGKFIRGKTSSVINEIFWFINNNEGDESVNPTLQGTNSGFGCISKSGTIHWYNINYLVSNINNNYPTFIGKEFPPQASSMVSLSDFLDNWILGSSHFEKFIKIPSLNHLSPTNITCLNQLAVIDGNKNLKLLSPLNGLHSITYELPRDTTNYSRSKSFIVSNLKLQEPTKSPLSQFEIETCKPFVNLVDYNNIQVHHYDVGDDELEAIAKFYEDLNSDGIVYKAQKRRSTVNDNCLSASLNADKSECLNADI